MHFKSVILAGLASFVVAQSSDQTIANSSESDVIVSVTVTATICSLESCAISEAAIPTSTGAPNGTASATIAPGNNAGSNGIALGAIAAFIGAITAALL